MGAAWEIQKGVYAKLNGDVTLTGKVTGIYDSLPDQTSFPYVVIGDFTETPWDTFTKQGEEHTLTIHVFSNYSGNKETLDIIDNIVTLLQLADFTVNGYQLVGCRREFKNILNEENGQIRHGIVRFRILVREN